MIQTADFNHQDFQAGHEQEADKSLLVKFFLREKRNETESLKQGRPIFQEKEYIEIRIAGKRDAQVCRPARESDKNRFPEHYRRFKARIEEPLEGTPLSEWPQMSRSQVEELAFLHIKTVEQLAEISDVNCTNIHGGLTLKQRAKDFLEAAEKNPTELLKELASQNDEIAELKAQVAQLVSAANAPSTIGPKKAPVKRKPAAKKPAVKRATRT